MNKIKPYLNLFTLSFSAILIKGLVWGLDWPSSLILLSLLSYKTVHRMLDEKKIVETSADITDRVARLETRSNLTSLIKRSNDK